LLIVGSCNGQIRALQKDTGRVEWTYDIHKDGHQSQFHGDPLITDDLVVVGTDGEMGHVYAFERTTGKVRWKYRVDERGVATDVIRLGSNVYAVTLADELICLDLESGRAKWTFHSQFTGESSFLTSSPAVAADCVYFGGLDGRVYALDAQSGKLIWSRELGGRVSTSVVLRARDLYMGTAKRRLWHLDAGTGEVLSDLAVEAEPIGRLFAGATRYLFFWATIC
jgi:outer membrane protein assembly factor BamB